MTISRRIAVAVLVILALAAAGAGDATARAVRLEREVAVCPVPAAAVRGPRIVRLETAGVACGTAQRIAAKLARQLARGRPLSIGGTSSVEVSSTVPCARCAARTQVTVDEAAGRISFSVGGLPQTQLPRVAFPPFPLPATAFPSAPSASGGGMTV